LRLPLVYYVCCWKRRCWSPQIGVWKWMQLEAADVLNTHHGCPASVSISSSSPRNLNVKLRHCWVTWTSTCSSWCATATGPRTNVSFIP
jgi:hypothetical protein